ncbi:uncharacterized protein EDB91DRAFT_354842 [Suillus paluster]|uniref:uncharacterized protein n=1 Tax=Suillus paluster TaxID=48578 RepID=UPI001B880463|nr:uncharacterized protein EDB91DRAFT_354842 [Suillus paluster]KAG1740535.1 hypothetical protein EDB91DRAFT_354842 [Suillus paluster]
MFQPLHPDNPSSKFTPREMSQKLSQEIASLPCDTQKDLLACLERVRDVLEDKSAEEEMVDDPAEVVVDRLAVSLDWTLITAVVFVILGTSYLGSPAFTTFGNSTTHELLLKLTQITNDTAMNDAFLALLAQTPSHESPHYVLSRMIVHTSIVSSYFVAFVIGVGKLRTGRHGLQLNMPSHRKHRSLLGSNKYLPGSSQFTPMWFMVALTRLPYAFALAQLVFCMAIIVTHSLAL